MPTRRRTRDVAALCVLVAAVGLVAWWPRLGRAPAGCAVADVCQGNGTGNLLMAVTVLVAVVVGMFVAVWVLLVSPRRDDMSNLSSARRFCMAGTVGIELLLGVALVLLAVGDNADRLPTSALLAAAMLLVAIPLAVGPHRAVAFVLVCAALAALDLVWSAYLVLPTSLLLVHAGSLLASVSSAAQAAHTSARVGSSPSRAPRTGS